LSIFSMLWVVIEFEELIHNNIFQIICFVFIFILNFILALFVNK